MRNFLAGLVVVGLAVAPALATIDVQLLANASTSSGNLVAGTGTNNLTLNVGQTAVVGGFFVGNGHGVVAIGGSVVASGASALGTGTGFAYLSSFQGFQGAPDGEGGIVPGTTILPTTPTLAVNGAVSPIGSAQGTLNVPQTQFYDTYAATTPKQLFSYTVTATAPGVVTLQWQEAPAGGFSGWYTTDFAMVNGVNNNAALTVTVNTPVTGHTITASAGTGGTISPSGAVNVADAGSQTFTITPNAGYWVADVAVDGVHYNTRTSQAFTNVTADHTIAVTFKANATANLAATTPSTVDNSVTGRKTLWRTKKSLVRLTFASAFTTVPNASNISILQCKANGEQVDMTSNFTFTAESSNTVLKILDTSTAGVMANKTWYAIRLGQADGTVRTFLTPVLVGDYDGNSVLSTNDTNPIVAKLSSPSVSPNDADRRDLDGNMVISTSDSNPAIAGLASPTLPAKPTPGW